MYVTGYSYGGYATTIKYNSSGDTTWVRKYHSPDSASGSEATALTIDNSGNVYITGLVGYDSAFSFDYLTIKYDSSGDTIWVRKYRGPVKGNNCATGIVVDNNGNVYVTGNSDGIGTSYREDYATIKYSSSGGEEWVQRYNGPVNMVDVAYSIALDNKGYVYVTGESDGYSNTDYVTIKYSTVGIEEESREFRVKSSEITAYPTPFVKTTSIEFNLYEADKSREQKNNKIQIYDIGGRLIKTTNSNIIGDDLKEGVYFVKLNDNKKLLKIIKLGGIK